MSEKHRHSAAWDEAMKDCPTMYCGRLDMDTWNAHTGVAQKMVYFDGEDERVVCEGRRADSVAYAANRYQPLVEEVDQLRAQVSILESGLRGEQGIEFDDGYCVNVAALRDDNQKLREQLASAEAAIERAKMEDSGYFLALYDAWRAATTNEECAHLLRVYCTDGKVFWAKYGPRHLETI